MPLSLGLMTITLDCPDSHLLLVICHMGVILDLFDLFLLTLS